MNGNIGGDFGGEGIGRIVVEDEAHIWTLEGTWSREDKPHGQPQPGPIAVPPLICYSMRDPRWIGEIYAGGETFGQSGCYTTSVAIVNSLTGSLDEPPIVARAMREAGCYEGAFLSHPDRIPLACPGLRYDGPIDVSKDGELRWHHTKANMERVFSELHDNGILIIEVDFRPDTEKYDQHFVVGLEWNEEQDDILIVDPWDGKQAFLLKRYELLWYSLGKGSLQAATCGLRLLRPVKK